MRSTRQSRVKCFLINKLNLLIKKCVQQANEFACQSVQTQTRTPCLGFNAFNGNRTRVDPLEGGHSTTEL